uniref:CUB domain-containing protein n=1 Tax=Schistocephalus solidus TaxID=70667 RepID=A0A183T1T6_SCHSO
LVTFKTPTICKVALKKASHLKLQNRKIRAEINVDQMDLVLSDHDIPLRKARPVSISRTQYVFHFLNRKMNFFKSFQLHLDSGNTCSAQSTFPIEYSCDCRSAVGSAAGNSFFAPDTDQLSASSYYVLAIRKMSLDQ